MERSKAIFAAASATVTAVFLTIGSPATAQPDACPAGGTKIDQEGPQTFYCAEGEVVTGICLKAGPSDFGVGDGTTPGGPGCYEYSIGSQMGSVSGGGTSRDCKTISHSYFYCGPGEPTPMCGNEIVEDGEQCDPPGRIDEVTVCTEDCQIIEDPEPMCGNEIVEDGEQCDPPGRIDELLVCSQDCQLVEVPEPTPEPECGNEVTEAGETCDPPGRINELLVCTEDCQIIEQPIEEGEGSR